MVTPTLAYAHALQYTKTVKDKFKDTREKFDEFLEVLADFRAGRIDTYGVISKVRELFKDQQELLLGFNSFLPKCWTIALEVNKTPPTEPVTFEEAISFIKNVKARFQDNDRPYISFIDSLHMYKTNSRSLTELYEEVAFLFRDHHDLFVEFITRFSPP